jgi:heavy metal sensor kinase
MSLATRVSLFFLGSLACTLAGFSAALYFLIAGYLDRQMDERLDAALGMLTAAVEIKKDGVEWEPEGRRLVVAGGGDLRWVVRDHRGQVTPQGRSPGEPLPAPVLALADEQREVLRLVRVAPGDCGPWRVVQIRLEPPAPQEGARPIFREEPGKFPFVTVTVAGSLRAQDATLRLLLGTLAGLSVLVWTGAALIGRRLCRRTLAPVTRMAESARAIPASEPGQRLAVAATGDELEDLGRAFNDLLARLQEAFERQRRFTGDSSHQLRTPLAVMRGQVEVALRRDRAPEEYRRVLGIVAEQSSRLQRIVEMLLFLARADAEAARPELTPLSLHPWLQEHLQGWKEHPRVGDLRLLPGGEELHVRAHAPLLAQVVDILLDNACKYSAAGTPVVVSLQEEPERVRLIVEDRGCGINAEELPRVFEPFFRSPHLKETATAGVGLGLAIARRVTTALGGTIEVESEPGHGSRLIVRLVSSGLEEPARGRPG